MSAKTAFSSGSRQMLMVALMVAGLWIPGGKLQAQQSARASGTKGLWSVEGAVQAGYVFQTNDFVRGANMEQEVINSFRTAGISLSKQTTGNKEWQQLYHYPRWGVGVAVYDFYNPEEVGTPIAVYGFFHAPFKRWGRYSLNYTIGFGATFNWRRYDPVNNVYNDAIGAGQSFYIDAGMDFRWRINRHLALQGGFSLTHFSNGALKKPNKGLNTIAPRITLAYTPSDAEPQEQWAVHDIPPAMQWLEWMLVVFGGSKNVVFDSVDVNVLEKYEGISFPVFGMSATLSRQLNHKIKLGIGWSWSYNGALNAQVAVDNNELEVQDQPLVNHLQCSVFPSFEWVVGRVSLLFQPSWYLYRHPVKDPTPVFYQKIGLRVQLTDRVYGGITLRDYSFHVSDFIEWNVGYRIPWHNGKK